MSRMDLLPSPLPETLGFPFDDDSRRDINFHLDRLVEEHPDIAEPLRNFREGKSSKKKRTENSGSDHNTPSGDSTPVHTEKEVDPSPSQQPEDCSKEKRGLDAKLRYTVPDMRREQEDDQERVGRSQSAPPSQQNPMDSGNQANQQQQVPPTREPVVRHIPIFVEGRDEPVIPKDFVDSPFPREKRNLSREASPIPPMRRNVSDHTTRPQQDQPTSIHVEHPQPSKHTSSVHINHSSPHPQQDTTTPIEIKINPEPTPKQPAQPQQTPPQQQPKQPSKQPPPPKAPLGPLEKVNAVQQEVGSLMERVEQYTGGSRQDKEYVYLDEMLTRNLLKLDDIETEGKEDVRAARKEAIRQIQRCISHLESKAPVNGGATTENQSTDNKPESELCGVQNSQDTQENATASVEASSAETQSQSMSQIQPS